MKFIKSLITLLIISSSSFAQHQILGKIIRQNDNAPIEGASVSLNGTNISVISDINGIFILQAGNKINVNLVIRHLGYESFDINVSLPQQDTLKVSLKPSINELNEVEIVSTGYQKISKERATGSFATISNELFNQQVGTDILSRLPAIANSIVMDNSRSSTPQMMVRGLSTIRGPKNPLIILDNFPYDGDLTNINPNIVENITILKDASAASIWGAHAANGVIVITTKSGRFNQPISLNFNSNVTIGTKPDLGYLRPISSNDFIDVEQELFSRNFYNSQINSANSPVISPVVNLLNKVRIGELTNEEAQLEIDALRYVDARNQFNQFMYKPSVKQQYFLSAQGGVEKFSWISSIGYDYNKENLGSTFQRFNIRFQNTYRPLKQLSLVTGLYYTQNKSKSGRYGYNNVSMKGNSFVPYMLMADNEKNALAVPRNWNQNYIQNAGNSQLLDWNYYPLIDWQHETSTKDVSDILATVNIDYQILKGLNATLNYQFERQSGLNTNLSDEESFKTRDYINRFSQIENGSVIYNVPKGSILDKANDVMNANNIRGQLNYEITFGKHNITTLAGVEVRSQNSQGHQNRFYGYSPNNLTTGSVDYKNTFPNFPRGSSYIERGQNLSDVTKRFVSQFANAIYSIDDKYFFSASARRDASNLFGLKINDQWNPFWSTGLAWKLSNEKFYSFDFLSYVYLRATYGYSGNIDPAMVAVNTITYFPGSSAFSGEIVAGINNFHNPNLKWETSKVLNVAIDFRTKNKNVSGSIEFFTKKGEKLFGEAPLDYTTGVPPYMLRNVASMQGKGLDIELKSLNINNEFKWQTILNLSLYNDRIQKYMVERSLAREYVSTSTVPISGITGKPVYSIFAYRWAGLDPNTGEAQGYLNNEVSKNYSSITGVGTSVEDLQFFGSAVPTKYGSIINSFSYKNFSLQMALSFKLGYYFRRNSINYTNLFNNWVGHSDYESRWQQPGDERNTNVPVNQYTTNTNRDAFYNGSSILVEKGDHLRFQYINLIYDFKMPFNSKGAIKGLQVYFNANNIGILWKANKAGIDPDFNVGTTSLIAPTNYSTGIRAKF